MSEFIFKATEFSSYGTLDTALQAAKRHRNVAISREFNNALARWDETEGKLLKEWEEECDIYRTEQRCSMEELQKIQRVIADEYDKAVTKYKAGGLIYRMFHNIESYSSYEKKVFQAAGWYKYRGRWTPPRKEYAPSEYYTGARENATGRPTKPEISRPTRGQYKNQFTEFLDQLAPLKAALAMGASEIRIDVSMMKTFLRAQEESDKYLKGITTSI